MKSHALSKRPRPVPWPYSGRRTAIRADAERTDHLSGQLDELRLHIIHVFGLTKKIRDPLAPAGIVFGLQHLGNTEVCIIKVLHLVSDVVDTAACCIQKILIHPRSIRAEEFD